MLAPGLPRQPGCPSVLSIMLGWVGPCSVLGAATPGRDSNDPASPSPVSLRQRPTLSPRAHSGEQGRGEGRSPYWRRQTGSGFELVRLRRPRSRSDSAPRCLHEPTRAEHQAGVGRGVPRIRRRHTGSGFELVRLRRPRSRSDSAPRCLHDPTRRFESSRNDRSKHQKGPLARALLVFWSAREDSNLRPLPPQGSALPGCATRREPLTVERVGVQVKVWVARTGVRTGLARTSGWVADPCWCEGAWGRGT